VVTLKPQPVTLTTELPGRTSAYLVAEIRPQVSGLILERPFTEGATVKAGTLLYQIDPAPYQAAYDRAAAALAVAEAQLPALRSRSERLRELATMRAVGEQDAEDAEAALRQAEANVLAAKAAVDSARINLSYTPLKAPITGRIGRSTVTVGALVTAFQPVPLATIQQLDPIYVDVIQASADLLRLRRQVASGKLTRDNGASRTVKLLLEDGTPYPLEGSLQFQDVTVDPTTGSVTVRMVFPNPDHVLLPGMFVRAIVEEGIDEQAILAPQQGVSRDVKGNPTAWVVSSAEQVEQRQLEVSRAIGDCWLVTSGLSAGDRIIVEGLQKVRPGATVHAVELQPEEAGGEPDAGSGGPSAAVE
jgi:membrane fusion protein (multidrug efflux system)